MPADDLMKQAGEAGSDFSGDPGDQQFVMNRKVARLSGSPQMLVDRDFQRLQRQSPRSLRQNSPTTPSISGILLSAAKGRRGRKKF